MPIQQQQQQPENGQNQGSPRKSDKDIKDLNQLLREKEAQFHRTIANYEEHHSNLTRTNKRLE